MLSKKWFALCLSVLLLVMGIQSIVAADADVFTRDPDMELQVLTELNRWRIHRGLEPLLRNPDLDMLAMEQANYMKIYVPFTDFTSEDEFHRDQYGDGIVARAAYYGWPAYDDDPRKEFISEIAAYFPSVSGVINFWRTSEPHRKAVETKGFREAGVTVLRRGKWMIAYVELAGRPNVLPVTYDSARNMLYLTTDQSYYAESFIPLYMRFLDSQGNKLHTDDWLVWSQRVRLPKDPPNNLIVVVSDGIVEITTQVDLKQSLVFPADPGTPSPANTTLSTFSPIAASANLVVDAVPPAARAAPVKSQFQVSIVYDSTSFTLINQAGHRLDLSKLAIQSDVIHFNRTAQWLGRYSEVPLNDFPSSWCMQVWSFPVFTGPPALPGGCTLLASGRSLLNAGDRFWLTSRFDVYYDGDMLVSCYRDDHQCGFDVPN